MSLRLTESDNHAPIVGILVPCPNTTEPSGCAIAGEEMNTCCRSAGDINLEGDRKDTDFCGLQRR